MNLGIGTCLLVHLLLLASRAGGFQVFSEQQIVALKDETRPVYYNNTEYGSTHVTDYWTQIDKEQSPLQGTYSTRYFGFKHVRLSGCFVVDWAEAADGSYADSTAVNDVACVELCDGNQTYFLIPNLCRCAIVEENLVMTEYPPEAQAAENCWTVYRKFDFRSSMSPATYDVMRRPPLLYQIVTARVPTLVDEAVTASLRHYIHAVNVLEQRPAFEFDVQLERMIFNAVWDFHPSRSRMVGLSFQETDGLRDPNARLDFTWVSFNTSKGYLEVTQEHTAIQTDLETIMGGVADEMLGLQDRIDLASCDGLATVDIRYGTYYTVVPRAVAQSPTIVHKLVAIDIARSIVLAAYPIPATLFNLQVNSLSHKLYGSGVDLDGNYIYWQLGTAELITTTVGTVTQTEVNVVFEFTPLSGLPRQYAGGPLSTQYMFLQSITMEHEYNYTWFTYKETPQGNPLVAEFHEEDSSWHPWNNDSIPTEAVFSTLINTAPRIIFTLYPPTIQYARFNQAGTKIFVHWSSPTLRGAVPVDTTGDMLPNTVDMADKMTRAPCDQIFDDYTVSMVGAGAWCQWTSDSDVFIEISQASPIMPGDLIRIRPAMIYRGRELPSGGWEFSQPSTAFAVVQVPEVILPPDPDISGNFYLDSCTRLVLDATNSKDHGYRGIFNWTLDSMTPETRALSHGDEIERIVEAMQGSRILRIDPNILQAGTSYFFTLKLTSLWDPGLVTYLTREVIVAEITVPPLVIFGPSRDVHPVNQRLSIVAEMDFAGCVVNLLNEGDSFPRLTYSWTGCRESDTVVTPPFLPACPSWSSEFNLNTVSGEDTLALVVPAQTLVPFENYTFTVRSTLSIGGTEVSPGVWEGSTDYTNMASVVVEAAVGPLILSFGRGNSFSVPKSMPIVIDVSDSSDPSDPSHSYGQEPTFLFGCRMSNSSGPPCPLVNIDATWETSTFTMTTTSTPVFGTETTTSTPDPAPSSGRRLFADDEGQGDEQPRRLTEHELVPAYCIGYLDQFSFRNRVYDHALNVTAGQPSTNHQYCTQGRHVLIIQNNTLAPGIYIFDVLMAKTIAGETRNATGTMTVEVIDDTGVPPGSLPIVNIITRSPEPVVVSSVLRMEGVVVDPDPDVVYDYAWSASIWTANPAYDPNAAYVDENYSIPMESYVPIDEAQLNFSDPAHVRTPAGSAFLVLSPDMLSPDMLYKFRLTVTNVNNLNADLPATGYAEYIFVTQGLPPSGGTLDNFIGNGDAFATSFEFDLAGFGSSHEPLSYQFGYRRDYNNSYELTTLLAPMFVRRTFTEIQLPPGLPEYGYQIEVVGFVRNAINSTYVTPPTYVTVMPPADRSGLQTWMDRINNSDTQTALLEATSFVQFLEADDPYLPEVLNSIGPDVMNITQMPQTEDVIVRTANFFTEMSRKGVNEDVMVGWLNTLLETTVANDMLNVPGSLQIGLEGTAEALLSSIDAMIPGEVTEPVGTSVGIFRRLQATNASIDRRTPEAKYSQLNDLQDLYNRVAQVILPQMLPGEVPAYVSLTGHEVYLGRDFKDTTTVQSSIQTTFDVPTLNSPIMPDVYSYRYILWKKLPWTFMNVPTRQTFNASESSTSEHVPEQGISAAAEQYLWHAMTLTLTNSTGGFDTQETLRESVQNETFDRLPRIASAAMTFLDAAEVGDTYRTLDHAATCYRIDLGTNVSTAAFTSQGLVYHNDRCVSRHLADIVVFVDNLVKEIETFDQSLLDRSPVSVLENRPSAAMVGFLMSLLMGLTLIIGGGYKIDHEYLKDEVPVDLRKMRVKEEMEDPKEMFMVAMKETFNRNHLMVGLLNITIRHRKFSRPYRSVVIFASCIATNCIVTLLHTWVHFKAQSQYWATGMAAGILLFPMVQLFVFMFEWRPLSPVTTSMPQRSKLAKAMPLKDQAQPTAIFQPKRPPVPKHIRDPHRLAPQRVQNPPGTSLPLQLPVMFMSSLPLETLPKVKTGDRSKKPAPPAEPKNREPRPPSKPPPADFLMVSRPQTFDFSSVQQQTETPAVSPMMTKGSTQETPFGLSLPELPPLPQGTTKNMGKSIPAPPPKRPGAGPKPPQAPPPLTKMFFAVPQNNAHPGLPKAPPMPPMKAMNKGPSLPPLPKILRPNEVLSVVKAGGDSSRNLAPPPPPKEQLRRVAAGAAPAPPPETPRDDDMVMMLPGSLEVTPRNLATPFGGPPTPAGMGALSAAGTGMLSVAQPPTPMGGGAPEDTEADPPLPPGFVQDPEHTMAPNSRVPPPPPLPPGGIDILGTLQSGQRLPIPRVNPGGTPTGPRPQVPLHDAMQPGIVLPGALLPLPPPGTPDAASHFSLPPGTPDAASLQLQPIPPGPDLGLELPDLRNTPGQGRVPQLPKHMPLAVPVPTTALAKVPTVAKAQPNALVPPPPPPPLGMLPRPPPQKPSEDSVRQLAPWAPGSPELAVRPPKPPHRPPRSKQGMPVPPAGPPPAHAIALQKAKAGMPGVDVEAIVRSAKPPPAEPPQPPTETPRGFVRTEAAADTQAPLALEDGGGPRAVPVAPSRQAAEPAWDKAVIGTLVIRVFGLPVEADAALGTLACMVVVIVSYGLAIEAGTYLSAEDMWFTYLADFIGVFTNLFVFESVKCIVIACLAIVRDETVKRQAAEEARKLRMELKAQRLQEQRARLAVGQ